MTWLLHCYQRWNKCFRWIPQLFSCTGVYNILQLCLQLSHYSTEGLILNRTRSLDAPELRENNCNKKLIAIHKESESVLWNSSLVLVICIGMKNDNLIMLSQLPTEIYWVWWFQHHVIHDVMGVIFTKCTNVGWAISGSYIQCRYYGKQNEVLDDSQKCQGWMQLEKQERKVVRYYGTGN